MIMTHEDKDLLLRDLCSRLPYGVKVEITHWRNRDKDMIDSKILRFPLNINKASVLIKPSSDVRPYLFPLSSMTEKQNDSWRDAWFPDLMTSTDFNYPESDKYLVSSHAKSLQWLYENHFDVNGLIEKGLAIDATGLNIY